jgi:hypothetical protein
VQRDPNHSDDVVPVYTALSKRQHDALQRLASANDVTVEFLIRRAIERMLDDAAKPPMR